MTWTTRPRSELSTLAVIDQGQGPLVILLHGVGLRAEAWGAQIDALVAAGYRVLCPDMPGHGQSSFDHPTGLEAYVHRTASVLTEPAVLIGHSMGALIALRLAADVPDSVLGVAALNAIHRRPVAAHKAVVARASALEVSGPNDPTVTLQRWFGEASSAERQACRRWLTEVDPAAYKSAYTAFAETDGPSDDELARIACPALFMTGADEPNSTPEMSRDMARLVPSGQAAIIAGAAHMLPMTHPAEVNAQLLEFVGGCQP
ncbi:alpha/beta fold hydrolase [Ruegeria faecimaris]|uniref:alpha/beta fold hydrolase n=1 Tax=Ruegeria faecimaris TaxID=686389 RepID=UPI00249269EA|nr:alpha/beta hydrolase [Ruegeria faecimaris]